MADYSGGGSRKSEAGAGSPAAAPRPGAQNEQRSASPASTGEAKGAPGPGGESKAPTSLLPALSLPKGGGAIRGIGEKFSVNAATGTASLSIPLPASPGRSGFGPALDLSYDSGAGNGPFGLGFQLSVPMVSRKTDKGLPRYLDADDTDEFTLAGAEDLVPERDEATGAFTEVDRGTHRARRYRPRVEGAFSRIERWVKKTTGDPQDGDVHFRVTTRDNVTHVFGSSANARIADPAHPATGRNARVFSWLLEETRDDKGNIVRYEYKAEDGAGVLATHLSEKSRFERVAGTPTFRATAQRYLKRVLYCNAAPGVADDFLMELVFDYGEHTPAVTTTSAVPSPDEAVAWNLRSDPFSSYRSTFEVRTYRLCRRVLMFHRFEAPDPVTNVRPALLVRSTDFSYDATSTFTHLVGVIQAGYRFDSASGQWQRQVMPTLALGYEPPVIHDQLQTLPQESLSGLQGGVDGSSKQWVDLDGEGIPGVLINQGRAWFYKANRGDGVLDAPRVLSTLPSPSSLTGGAQQLQDLGGDGLLDLVAFNEPAAGHTGYFERTPDGTFEALRRFETLPNINWQDPNLRFIDLDGDGLADLLLTEDQALVWSRSRGKQGFERLERVVHPSDEDRGPAVVFADGTERVQLADMSGDGLVDIVRIRNGEVCYWPNLGYGRFGAKITLENSPRFAGPEEFDARRVRFGDVDGSGTTDILYAGRDGIALYLNESGNRLADAFPIRSIPPVDNVTSLSLVDVLGQGTACLVWSSPLPTPRSIFFVDLMDGKKPHLLKTINNNLGAETTVEYTTSTKFYLEDKAAGIPWLTRLSFPVHVVERMQRHDAISGSRLVSSYRYRHGFFDGVEREFRGFARVEQTDAEEFTVGPDTDLFQAPVRTISWNHTGAWLEKERLESELAKEYFQNGPPVLLLPDTLLPPGLTIQDQREAARALRGRMLRQEVYALDGTAKEPLPYATTEQNFQVRLLQSSKHTKHAVFFVHPSETVATHSERNPNDPRVTHDLVLEVDLYGNLKRKVAIAYGRATGELEQQKSWATLSETDFINKPTESSWYRVGVEAESRSFEVTGLTLPPSGQGLVTLAALKTIVDGLNPANDLPFEAAATSGVQRRLLGRKQQLFYKNDVSGPLALGDLESLALPYESYQLALTTGIVSQLSAGSLALSGTAFDPNLLLTEGKYVQRDAHYWTASGRVVFDPARFYLPVEAVDPFGGHFFVTYDAFALLIESTRDPLYNVVQSINDYRVLSPSQITDPNLNRVAVEFDALGMVIATAVMGKAGAGEGDTLADPTTRLEYDLLRWQTSQSPTFVHTFAREKHGAANPRFQETFAYSDGFGRVAMQKVQAEPAPGTTTPRWVGTGRTVFNNKGNPVKQYEPFFSATSDFEIEDAIVATGVTPIIHYDPLDRVIRTELPDGSESRVEFDAWQQKTFDPNDAIAGTRWLTEHQAGTADQQRAAALALAHADTPTIAQLDSLGRTFLTDAHNRTGGVDDHYFTKTELDIEGNALAIFDARQIKLHEQDPSSPLRSTIAQTFDVLQRRLKVVSPDAGTRLTIADVAGKPLRSWDNRGQTMRSRYDALQRPTHMFVTVGATERLFLRTVFGEALDPAGVPAPVSPAQALNLRGKPHLSFDCAGLVTADSFDFKGNLLSGSRRLAVDYTTEPDWIDTENPSDPAVSLSSAAILAAAAPLLENESFATSSTYDALNRVTTHTMPDGSVTRPTYNEANLLEALFASVRGAPEQTVIADLDYNARGQRVSCAYGNGTTTTYTYDPKTFRLTELQTLRGTTKLQWLLYTFDPVGNIVALRDQSDTGPIFSGTAPVNGDGLYEYDPLYRLVSATGREHPSTQPIDLDPPPGTGIPHANDLQALLAYSETYVYDQVGNIEQMAHVAGPSGSLGWTRNYQYATDSNRLLKTSVPGSPLNLSETYAYDQHGSMTSMPHLAVMDWDYADRLKHAQKGAGSGTQHTYFTYDAAGQRARKVAVASGTVKERIDLGGYEIYRERAAAPGAAVDFERQTLHVMEDQRRVAMAETKTREGGAALPTPTTRWRFQLDNHLGSATLELDATGNVISYEEYHPYGSTAFHTADGGAQVSAKRYRYTGKEKDDETGLYYHGARYYAPWLGRWTVADPLGLGAPGQPDINLYAYVRGAPTDAIDPHGLEDVKAPAAGNKATPAPRKSKAESTASVDEPKESNKLTASAKEHSYYHNFPNTSVVGFSPKAWIQLLEPGVRTYLAERLRIPEAAVDPRVIELVLAQSALETTYGKDLFNWNFGNIRADSSQEHVYVENAFEDYATEREALAARKQNGAGTIKPINEGANKFRITYPRMAIEGARFASYPNFAAGLKTFLEKPILTKERDVRTSVAEAALSLQEHLTKAKEGGKAVSLKEAATFYQSKLGRFALADPGKYIFALMLRVVQMNPDRDQKFYQAMKKQGFAL